MIYSLHHNTDAEEQENSAYIDLKKACDREVAR